MNKLGNELLFEFLGDFVLHIDTIALISINTAKQDLSKYK